MFFFFSSYVDVEKERVFCICFCFKHFRITLHLMFWICSFSSFYVHLFFFFLLSLYRFCFKHLKNEIASSVLGICIFSSFNVHLCCCCYYCCCSCCVGFFLHLFVFSLSFTGLYSLCPFDRFCFILRQHYM